MTDIVLRLGVLILICAVGWLLVWGGRRFIEGQRYKALQAAPPHTGNNSILESMEHAPVRILVFSSPDCRQCHQLQAPALERLQHMRGESVSVVEVDATTETSLVQTYHVLTVPSTVILDQSGKAHAVNYGFAPTPRLLQQVEEVLAG
ncbi:thioredoxin family protein [Ktedonospora formicarum]|uniref:Thiol reductase thioredoxin n=1 Tax=Ktedonospora formicarum TaxID=2778364 RepID=A0A8J3I3J0_9CHLR|nr:thioredoxin family protein [Ktedonospora formicarum]GHO46103.1 thiol reductase thioredoxin [Ktedonospora formicarum]